MGNKEENFLELSNYLIANKRRMDIFVLLSLVILQ